MYIPSRKRKQKQPRFHGAFTGGFSAGHFNSVADGSAEGFVPRQDESDIRRQQKPEDFMDDQDHNEWGGPTSVREEYAIAAAPNNSSVGKSSNAMIDLVKPPAQNVGHRLLRILGWRDRSTAYVPREEKETVLLTSTGDSSIESLLSSKRLKRIQLQQARVKLPSPKLDTCGLGYDSYANAPEFRAHRERRRKEAQERAKAVTASSAENRNVYRLSNLLDDNDDTRQSRTIHHDEEDDPLVSYETEQSFVGTKTVGGFALREDDDDVYDDHVRASKSNRDEYDTVIYEHASDDENDHDTRRNETGEDLGSVFASWATSKDREGSKSSRGVTSDGRPPLPGFVLGASATSTKVIERYPGPDLPSGYEPKRHEFGNDEYPSELKEETKALHQSLLEERRKTMQQERKVEIHKMQMKRESGPMASSAFAGLAAAMKNRFTPSAPEPAGSQHGQPAAIGLHRPSKESINVSIPREPVPIPKPITITRTTMTFVPESLLCKRFHVQAPAHAKPTVGGKSVAELKGEAAYFEKEIMSKAAVSGTAVPKTKKSESRKASTLDLFGNDGETEVNTADKRPSMKVLESIFEPDSESSGSEKEVETSEAVTTGFRDQISCASSHGATAATAPSGIPDGMFANPVESTSAALDHAQEDIERKSEIRKDRRGRKRRSRSRSPSTCSGSDRSKPKQPRKRKEKKKRKKSHKSSRRRNRAND